MFERDEECDTKIDDISRISWEEGKEKHRLYMRSLYLIRDKKYNFIRFFKKYITFKIFMTKIFKYKLKKKFFKNIKKLNKKSFVVNKIKFLNIKVKKYENFLENITFNFKNLSLKKKYN